MNSAVSEMMLHCLNTLGNNSTLDRLGGSGGTEMSVLERQRAVLKLQQQERLLHPLLQQPPQSLQQQQQQQNLYLPQLNIFASPQERGFQGLVINGCSGENGHFNDMDLAGMGNNNNGGWADYGGGDFSTPRSGITTTESSGLESAAGVAAVNGVQDYYGGRFNYANSRTAPPAVGAAGKDVTAAEKLNCFKKRKARKAMIIAAAEKGAEDDGDNNNDDNKGSNKKIKAFSQDEASNKINTAHNNKNKSSGSNQSNNGNNKNNKLDKEASGCTSKADNSKPDYIHVRARRGQATDSHSLAERVRREKISERMKYLQDLVPGCSKITGKAGMLDEIINYVQSLQRQVEFLSMKLAAVNPSLDSDIDDLLAKEILPVSCSSNLATIMGIGSDMANNQAAAAAYLEYNLHQIQQTGPLLHGSDMGVNSIDMGLLLRRTIGAPPPAVSAAPEPFLDAPPPPSCFTTQHIQNCLPWDPDLQELFCMELQPSGSGRPASLFPSQAFAGLTDPNNNIKMEM